MISLLFRFFRYGGFAPGIRNHTSVPVPRILNEGQKVRALTQIAIFLHAIGIIGIGAFNSTFFSNLTPMHMLIVLSFFVVCAWDQRFIFLKWAGLTYLLSFSAEWVGVRTGLIFGNYHYEHGLGVQFLKVPLLIGLTWVTVICGAVSLARRFTSNFWTTNILTSAFAILYDWCIEHVAIKLHYWEWQGGATPLWNYACWGMLAFLFSVSWQKFNLKPNKFGMNFFLVQLVFFLVLRILL